MYSNHNSDHPKWLQWAKQGSIPPAEEVRKEGHTHYNPPVRIMKVARGIGLEVYQIKSVDWVAAFDGDVQGYHLDEEDRGHGDILIHKNLSLEQKRYAIAYIIAHLMVFGYDWTFFEENSGEGTTDIERRYYNFVGETHQHEQIHEYASVLLTPREMLNPIMEFFGYAPYRLARVFQVPAHVIRRRFGKG